VFEAEISWAFASDAERLSKQNGIKRVLTTTRVLFRFEAKTTYALQVLPSMTE